MKNYHKNKHEKICDIKNMLIFFLCLFPYAIIYSSLVDWTINKNPIYGIRVLLIGALLPLVGSFVTTTMIEKKKNPSVHKFHSAEHMVLNAYKSLKRVPSLQEITKYSRFSNSCGTNLTTQLVITFLFDFACTFLPNEKITLGILLVPIPVCVLLQCGFLNFLQKFTTSEPTEKELTLAIEGLKFYLLNENKEKEKCKFFKFLH